MPLLMALPVKLMDPVVVLLVLALVVWWHIIDMSRGNERGPIGEQHERKHLCLNSLDIITAG